MTKIITSSEVQQNIGDISQAIKNSAFVVTKRGKGHMVILPYFDDCDKSIMNFLEDYEMSKNKQALRNKYQKSSTSSNSDLIL